MQLLNRMVVPIVLLFATRGVWADGFTGPLEQGTDNAHLWKLGVGAAVLFLGFIFHWTRKLARINKALQLAQEAQRKTAEELSLIVDNAGVGILITDGQRTVVRMNRFCESVQLRCEPGAYIGASVRSSFVSDAEYESFMQEVRGAGTSMVSLERTVLRSDGTVFLANAVGSFVNQADRSQGMIWFTTDITEQRAAEDKLTQTFKELETILNHAWIGVFVTSGERKILRMNRYAEEVIFRCPPGDYIGQSTQSLFATQSGYEDFTRKVRAAAAANVSVESVFYRKDGSAFLAKSIGSLLDPDNPSKGAIWLVTDITDERAAEEKLKRTLNELDIIFQNASIGISFSKDRHLLRVNKALADMLGYEESALIGQSSRIYYPSDAIFESMAKAYEALESGQKTFAIEIMMHRADGTELLCAHSGSLVDPADPSKGSIWTYKDITAERAAEVKLAQTLQELEAILGNAWIGVFVTNGERKIVRMNHYCESVVFQCTPGGYIGQSTRSMFSTNDDYEAFTRKVRSAATANVSIEYTFSRKDGTSFLAKSVGSLLDSTDPAKGAVWLVTDITEQTAAEEKLARTLSELDIIFQNASIGIAYVQNRNIVRVNTAVTKFFGYPAQALIGQSSRMLYPSDEVWQSMAEAYVAFASGQSVFKCEAMMRRSDGTDLLCAVTASLVDHNDPAKGTIWLHQDITEQRAAEDKLTRALSELDIIFNNASVGIAFFVDRRFARINKTYETMFGWSAAEVIGQTGRRLYASDEAYAAVGDVYQRLAVGERVLKLDLELRCADGHGILCECVSSYIDPMDPAKGVVWLVTDVTELRQAQAALQNARDDALEQKTLIEQQHQLVAQTLDQVATLLNNSGQGFLSFGGDLLVDEGFSRECTRIFGRDVHDLPLPQLLCPTDASQRGFLEKTLRLIMTSTNDPLRRDAYIGLLPTEYRLGERYCTAQYRLLGDARMMLILTDVTDERQLKERLALERLRLEFIVHALENRDDVLEMLRDFEHFRSRVLPDLLSFERRPRVLLAEVLRQIHTFKSLFAQASLPTIPQVLHELESRLGQLHASTASANADSNSELDTNAIKHQLGTTDLGAALQSDLTLLRQKLGDDFFNSEREIRVAASKLTSLEDEASTLYGADSRMLCLIRFLRYVPLRDLIEPHFTAAEQLAQRQDKLLAPITCTGDVALIDPDVYGAFCKSLVHLFRNAVDHGIEDVDTRLLANKSETASIRCTVITTKEHLVLTVTDDGCGIDVQRVRSKAIDLGKLSVGESIAMGDADALMLVFADGVTTREEVSTISGRGVGLSAVQQELLHLGGTARIESTIGQGTRFAFTLPYQMPIITKAQSSRYASAKKFLAPLPGVIQAFCETHLKLAVTVDTSFDEFTADGLFDFTALLSLGSGLDVRIGLSIERPLLLQMTRCFEPDFPESEIEALADSVGAEIANTVVGNASVYFTHLARRVAMDTPDIVSPAQRAQKIGPRAFRGFKGHAETGSFLIFCLLTEENPA